MKTTSIIIGIKGDMVLLAMKKRGHGVGKWNGFGGKKNEDETPYEAAMREIAEEGGIRPLDLAERGMLNFETEGAGTVQTYLYSFSEYEGELQETEEMRPQWFNIKDIPYDDMWEGDKHWIPLFLEGKNLKGSLLFSQDFKFLDYHIEEI